MATIAAVTASGTPYTVTTASIPGSGTVLYAVADARAGDDDIPCLLYAHGRDGGYDQFFTLPAWGGQRDEIIDNGWAWIEGTGGPGTTSGQENWGNNGARTAYVAYFNYVDAILSLGVLVILGRSMGGVIAAYLATRHPTMNDRASALILNSGVVNLAWAGEPGSNFSPAIWNAYGASDQAGYNAAIGDHDPMNFAASVWAGKKVLSLVGTADTTVPPASNGLALRAIYAGQPAIDALNIREGGDHSSANGSYQQVAAMTAFLLEVAGEPIPPQPPASYFRAEEMYVRYDGELYPITGLP